MKRLTEELRDRFGPLPEPVEFLLEVAELKILAGERGITALEVKDETTNVEKSGLKPEDIIH